MYLNYFNLRKEPFNITPDPELLFLSPSHKEALAAVIYGVKQRKGFVALVGEVGVGKTTIIRSFLEKIDKEQVKTIYVFNSNISFKALLKTIYQNMGHAPETDDVFEMVNQLHRILIEEYKAGRNVVLIVDEIQNMPVATLENLRMLSNLETSKDKLIQIVFSGQPEFEEKLDLHVLRQLRQRIAVKVNIMPLTREESLAYIYHRLSRTVQKDPDLFTRGALDTIVTRAGGIPRIINILCDNCLITSFGNQQKQVTAKVAKEIIADLKIKPQVAPRWRLALMPPLVVAIVALWFYAGKKPPAGAGGPVEVPNSVSLAKTDASASQPAAVETAAKRQDVPPQMEPKAAAMDKPEVPASRQVSLEPAKQPEVQAPVTGSGKGRRRHVQNSPERRHTRQTDPGKIRFGQRRAAPAGQAAQSVYRRHQHHPGR